MRAMEASTSHQEEEERLIQMALEASNQEQVVDPDNPDVNYFTRDVADRVPFMIRTLVYIWAVLVTIAVILINRKPKDP